MKRISKLFLSVAAIVPLLSCCSNFDQEFPDYEYTAGYFPYQYPVRTLILGDYIYDNSNDNAHKFVISVAMGGVRENKQDREFQVEVDESLCDGLLFSSGGDEIKPLPSNYYTLSSSDRIVIPKGKYNGGVEVQLTDEFFQDPATIKNTYVVPMRIISSSDVDSILPGKDFTLFGIKYINEYHGTYFYYGKSNVKDNNGQTVEEVSYDSFKFIEDCPLVDLTTSGRYQVSLSLSFKSDKFKGSIPFLLDFEENICSVTTNSSEYFVSGTGEFKDKAYSWGNKQRDGIVLKYSVTTVH